MKPLFEKVIKIDGMDRTYVLYNLEPFDLRFKTPADKKFIKSYFDSIDLIIENSKINNNSVDFIITNELLNEIKKLKLKSKLL